MKKKVATPLFFQTISELGISREKEIFNTIIAMSIPYLESYLDECKTQGGCGTFNGSQV